MLAELSTPAPKTCKDNNEPAPAARQSKNRRWSAGFSNYLSITGPRFSGLNELWSNSTLLLGFRTCQDSCNALSYHGRVRAAFHVVSQSQPSYRVVVDVPAPPQPNFGIQLATWCSQCFGVAVVAASSCASAPSSTDLLRHVCARVRTRTSIPGPPLHLLLLAFLLLAGRPCKTWRGAEARRKGI